MSILSVNIGKRKEVNWNGKSVQTGILKEPVDSPVMVSKEGLEGDNIINTKVHGGEHKAVYVYFRSHYDWWINQTKRDDLTPGKFGENLTVEGFDESNICGGDRVRAGEALLEAAYLRLPCYKLGIKMGDDRFPDRFMKSKRFGIYFKVIEEGLVKKGDSFEIEFSHPANLSFSEIISLYLSADPEIDSLKTALTIESLAPQLRESFSKKLIE